MARAFGARLQGILLANSSAPEARRRLAGGEATGNLSSTSRALEGRWTKADTIIKASRASLPGREISFITCPGGCASLHHRLSSVAPTGAGNKLREFASGIAWNRAPKAPSILENRRQCFLKAAAYSFRRITAVTYNAGSKGRRYLMKARIAL